MATPGKASLSFSMALVELHSSSIQTRFSAEEDFCLRLRYSSLLSSAGFIFQLVGNTHRVIDAKQKTTEILKTTGITDRPFLSEETSQKSQEFNFTTSRNLSTQSVTKVLTSQRV